LILVGSTVLLACKDRPFAINVETIPILALQLPPSAHVGETVAYDLVFRRLPGGPVLDEDPKIEPSVFQTQTEVPSEPNAYVVDQIQGQVDQRWRSDPSIPGGFDRLDIATRHIKFPAPGHWSLVANNINTKSEYAVFPGVQTIPNIVRAQIDIVASGAALPKIGAIDTAATACPAATGSK
jgi:hypothetical protein